MANTFDLAKSVEDSVAKAVGAEVEIQKERIIREAVTEFENQVRRTVGNVAISLLNYYSVESRGSNLVITVHNEKSTSRP